MMSVNTGGEVLLYDPLDDIPVGAIVEPVEGVQVVQGRLDNQQALQLKEARVQWAVAGAGDEFVVSFWLRPDEWSNAPGRLVDVCAILVGQTEYRLRKPADEAVLLLLKDNERVKTYPIYNWHGNDWMIPSDRANIYTDIDWHYVVIAFSPQGNLLSIDGFPARTIKETANHAALEKVSLLGYGGTTFSSLDIQRGAVRREDLWTMFRDERRGRTSAEELWRRYRSQRDDTETRFQNTLPVPYLDNPPVIDGTYYAGKWRNAAALSSLVSIHSGQLLQDGNIIFMGYDEEYLYLAARSYHQGEIQARHWEARDKPLWREESWELFLAAPDHDVVQFIVNPYGDVADFKAGDINWTGAGDFYGYRGDDYWYVEMKVAFEGSGLPQPERGALWKMNLLNSQASASWTQPQGVYSALESMGEVLFSGTSPVIRIEDLVVDDRQGRLSVSIINNDTVARNVTLSVERLERDGDAGNVLAALPLTVGRETRVEETIHLGGQTPGVLVIQVIEDSQILYHQQVGVPAVGGR